MRRRLYQRRKSQQLPTLNTIYISRSSILQNVQLLKRLQPQYAFFPVLKSNAYGHDIVTMLDILQNQSFPYVIVDSFPEYQVVYHHSKFNILLLGETLVENYQHFDLKRTTFAIYNIKTLQALAKFNKKIKIHLFLNTGMNREGIQNTELQSFLSHLQSAPHLQLEGVMSHLYNADNDQSLAEQIAMFKHQYQTIIQYGFTPKWRHLAASAGLWKIQDPLFNAARPGLALYGYNPFSPSSPFTSPMLQKLAPALTVESTIIALQTVGLGEGVSYQHQWKAEQESLIATVPFGYSEGWPRGASGSLSYTFKEHLCPQVGNICMNMSSCIANSQMQIGDKIHLITNNAHYQNTLAQISSTLGMIPYELLVRLDKGIRRKITE